MDRILRYIFISIIVSSIAYGYFTVTNSFVFRIVAFVGIFFVYIFSLIYFSKKIGKTRFKKQNNLNILKGFTAVTLVVLVYSIEISENQIVTIFFHPLAFSAYFISIVTFIVNVKSISFLMKFTKYFNNSIPFITLIDVLYLNSPVLLSTGFSFLLFEFIFTNENKRKLYLLIVLIVSIPIFIFFDYRSSVLIISSFLISFFIFKHIGVIRLKTIRVSVLIIIFSTFVYLFFNFSELYNSIIQLRHAKSFNTVDTRSFLFLEFFEDFKSDEFIFGRGYLGTYYSPYFKNWQGENGDFYNRFSIEIGALQLLLKGGLFLLISMLTIFIVSIYKGFLKSKPNSIKFSLAIWLMIELGLLTIENVPTFNLHYFFIWIVIGLLNQSSKPNKIFNTKSR